MAEEEAPKVSDLKKTQEELKYQIKDLETTLQEKREIGESRELEHMVKLALRQNKRLAEKVEYLMDTLIEASHDVGIEESTEKTIAALARSQLQIIDQIADIKAKTAAAEDVNELKKVQEKALTQISERINSLSQLISQLPYSAQIDTLKKEVSDVGSEVKTLEALVTTKAPEEVTSSINLVKADIDSLRTRLEDLGKELENVSQEERKRDEEALSKIEAEEEKHRGEVVGITTHLTKIEAEEERREKEEERRKREVLSKVETEEERRKEEVAGVTTHLSKIEEEEERREKEVVSIAAHLTNIDTLQAKIAALESSLDHLSGLVKEGKIETSKEISEKLGGLQLDVGIVEKLRTEIDSISRMRSEDKEKALSLLDRLSAIEKEIQKLENILGSYPAEEAQRTDYLKQKLDEVENEVRGIRQGDIKNMIKGEMDNLRRRMNEFEDDYRRRGLDVNQQQTLELQLIIEMLERIEDRLGRLGSKDSSVYINVGELHRTTDDLTRELNKLKSRESSETSRAIGEIKKRVNEELWENLSKYGVEVKKGTIPPEHIPGIKKGLSEAREHLEKAKGKRVNPEKVSALREGVGEIHEALPERVLNKDEVTELRKKIQEAKKAVERVGKKADVKPFEKALKKVGEIEKKAGEHEKDILETKEKVEEIKEYAKDILLKEEDVVEHFLSKISVNEEVKISDVANQLNMPEDSVTRILTQIEKRRPNDFVLLNTGYSAKLMGKEPMLRRLK